MGIIPEKIERWILPCFLFVFEVIMLVLFGALVRYSPLGTPVPLNESPYVFRGNDSLTPVGHVEQTYPRKLCRCMTVRLPKWGTEWSREREYYEKILHFRL